MAASQAKELVELANMRDRKLVVDFTYTFSPALEVARFYVESDRIGGLLHVELALKKMGNRSAKDVLWVLGPHLLSMLGMFHPLGDLEFACQSYLSAEGRTESSAITFGDGHFFQYIATGCYRYTYR